MVNDKLERGRLMEKIWLYHRLPNEELLRETWRDDLKSFSVPEIEAAWERWRKDARNEGRYLQSYDLVRVVGAKKNVTRETLNPDILVRGVSFTTDLLSDKLAKMNLNMPDLMKQIREAKSPSEKMLLCALASGDENALKNPVAQMLLKNIENAN